MVSTTQIKSIQDIMRKDVGVDGDAQRISQLTWMIFLKIFDDREQEYELLEDDYQSPLPKKYRWRNWAINPEGITGDALLEFVNNKLFPRLKELRINDNPAAYVIRSAFDDAFNYMKSGQLMRQVINKLNENFDFNRSEDRHIFGDIYEQILRDLQSAGNAGEYYTPRAVTQFMVDQVDPKLGEKMLDPACGTGGFIGLHHRTCARQVRQIDRRRTNLAGVGPGRREEATAAPAVCDQYAATRDRRPVEHPARKYAGPSPDRLRSQGPGRCGGDQSTVRRHGRGRHRDAISRRRTEPAKQPICFWC